MVYKQEDLPHTILDKNDKSASMLHAVFIHIGLQVDKLNKVREWKFFFYN